MDTIYLPIVFEYKKTIYRMTSRSTKALNSIFISNFKDLSLIMWPGMPKIITFPDAVALTHAIENWSPGGNIIIMAVPIWSTNHPADVFDQTCVQHLQWISVKCNPPVRCHRICVPQFNFQYRLECKHMCYQYRNTSHIQSIGRRHVNYCGIFTRKATELLFIVF